MLAFGQAPALGLSARYNAISLRAAPDVRKIGSREDPKLPLWGPVR
jgi:hypothetical protein